ncbi:hypothetical protein PHAVU_002G312012, partial [Phaseolus vulgaris]
TSKEGNSSISSQARETRKLLGGHCKCLEKHAFGIIITEDPRKDIYSISSQAWRRRKLLGGNCECLEKQAFIGGLVAFLLGSVRDSNIYLTNRVRTTLGLSSILEFNQDFWDYR